MTTTTTEDEQDSGMIEQMLRVEIERTSRRPSKEDVAADEYSDGQNSQG